MPPTPRSRSRRLTRSLLIGAISLALGPSLAGLAAAGPTTPREGPRGDAAAAGPTGYSTEGLGLRSGQRSAARAALAGVTPPVGTVRQFLGTDDAQGRLYRKDYILRTVGAHIEVWVALDIAFPAGDCRGAAATTITDAQAQAIATQFDTVIFPRESAAFSVAPDRDGSNALLGPDAGGNGGDYSGAGDKVVTLVDNIRDDNYYTFPAATNYIPGLFSSQFNELFDRNVITLDAYDWVHRTTATPPDAPTTDPCTSRPAAPNFYEATFAHEYQQLLQYYTDPNEPTWVQEGLAAYAEGLSGYANPKKTVIEAGADRRILCFQGFGTVKGKGNPTPQECGGPENSLTQWGDQGAGAQPLLADQGQVWSFMIYLKDRFGAGFLQALHADGGGQGLAGLQTVLNARAPGITAADVVHDFQLTTLLDAVLDNAQGQVSGMPKARVVSASLNSTVNLTNPRAYAADGVPANGADYVWPRDAGNRYLTGSNLTSLAFAGDRTLATDPLQWTVVSNDPDRAGNPVLFSGNQSSTDAYAIASVTVPTADPTLRYLAKYGAEFGYDYAYTVISTDGGVTYTPLAGDKTVDGPLGPGLNGTTTGFEPHTFDLSAYAGQTVLLGFRYVSDGGVNEGGFLVDDVKVGATLISDGSSTAPFKSRTQVRPVPTSFNVRLVGVDPLKLRALVQTYTARTFTLSKAQLAAFKAYPVVVAVVSYDEPTEQNQAPASYKLTANGVVQAGGGPAVG
ncbi:MAG TPA: peptidase M6 [Propionibacteriaceae bacterium]